VELQLFVQKFSDGEVKIVDIDPISYAHAHVVDSLVVVPDDLLKNIFFH